MIRDQDCIRIAVSARGALAGKVCRKCAWRVPFSWSERSLCCRLYLDKQNARIEAALKARR